MGNVLRHWVYFLGSPDEAKTFHYTARLTGAKGEEVRYTGKVNTLDISLTDITRGYECLVIGPQTANELKNRHDELEVKVTIIDKNKGNNNYR